MSHQRCCHLLEWHESVTSTLRTLTVTAVATITGIFNAVMNRDDATIALKPGDPAPDFSLQGSDGRTYRLKDLAGQIVVVAWYPKAFTGG
jgi:hypothetical protein